MEFNTALLHGAFEGEAAQGSTVTPIYQTNAFQQATAEKLESIFAGKAPGFVYTRVGNPTVEALERRLNFIEGGQAAVACASGMEAVSLALLNILESGDEVVAAAGIFGGTRCWLRSLAGFNIAVKFVQGSSTADFAQCISPATKLIFVESIGNPKLDIPDISELAVLAHAHNLPLIVDSTVTTPYLFKPLTLGADIVIHSTSKYINGSSNSLGGIIIVGGQFVWKEDKFPVLKDFRQFGKLAYVVRLRKVMHQNYGSGMAPFNAFLTAIGLETLGLRMERLCDNTLKLAAGLRDNKQIVSVNYPGLADNPFHTLAEKQFGGRYGALLTLRVGSKEKAFAFINKLRYAHNLSNIGDVRTLVVHPASTIYHDETPEGRAEAGVYDDLIRVSIGLEDSADLLADFTQALE